MHGRTVETKYKGPSRWKFLRDLVRARPGCIVFGSGDVWESRDIFRMIDYTGVNGASMFICPMWRGTNPVGKLTIRACPPEHTSVPWNGNT